MYILQWQCMLMWTVVCIFQWCLLNCFNLTISAQVLFLLGPHPTLIPVPGSLRFLDCSRRPDLASNATVSMPCLIAVPWELGPCWCQIRPVFWLQLTNWCISQFWGCPWLLKHASASGSQLGSEMLSAGKWNFTLPHCIGLSKCCSSFSLGKMQLMPCCYRKSI